MSNDDELSDVTYRDVLMGNFMEKKDDPGALAQAIAVAIIVVLLSAFAGGALGIAYRAFMWTSGLG